MALILSGVRVRLGARRVLDGVDARFEAGRIAVVLGPNGAGKTTLLRAAAGLIPAEGRVELDGQAVAAMPARESTDSVGAVTRRLERFMRTTGPSVAVVRTSASSLMRGAQSTRASHRRRTSSASSGSSSADSAESATRTRYPSAAAALLSPDTTAWNDGLARSGTRNAMAFVLPRAKLRARCRARMTSRGCAVCSS